MAEHTGSGCFRALFGQVSVEPYLQARSILCLARCAHSEWTYCLEQVRQRWRQKAPFVLMTRQQRAAVLRFLPLLESALLFENFDDPESLSLEDQEVGAERSMSHRGVALEKMGVSELHPLSLWCVSLGSPAPWEDCYGFGGLERHFAGIVRPRLLAFRVRCCSCHRRLRAGGIFSLMGLGAEQPLELISVYFTYDSTGRTIFAGSGGAADVALGRWNDGEWYEVVLQLDWKKQEAFCRHAPDGQLGSKNAGSGCIVPFVDALPMLGDGCTGIKLWHIADDFRASWTDILVA